MSLELLKQTGLNIIVSKPDELPDVASETILDGVLSLVFVVIGSISLIVIVIQSIRYSLSGGDPKKTADARNGIIYALVGLVVAISAWNIVNFAIDKVIPSSTAAQTSTVIDLLTNIAGIIVFVGGVIATIMIIVGGLRMITSGGNPDGLKNGRNTIIYALVGLVVSIVAGPIVHFILNRF